MNTEEMGAFRDLPRLVSRREASASPKCVPGVERDRSGLSSRMIASSRKRPGMGCRGGVSSRWRMSRDRRRRLQRAVRDRERAGEWVGVPKGYSFHMTLSYSREPFCCDALLFSLLMCGLLNP